MLLKERQRGQENEEEDEVAATEWPQGKEKIM